ncbi:MAG: DNA-protecting protein DprA [Oscillospiraceae bacterium]|nr:DNA-protecting protein DprA [Oscillospiraceae bacterium]
MTGAERGWLLLCADLADGLRPMTLPQVRSLRAALRQNDPDLRDPDRELTDADLCAAGLDRAARERILRLLGREAALDAYLSTALLFEIHPLTVVSPDYPRRLRERLGDDAPAVLFYCGDPHLLSRPGVSLTGSRSLDAASAEFARKVGALAAREGKVLISGNALGADQTAQNACLDAGGSAAAFLPGELNKAKPPERAVFVTETGWHLPFAPYRALQRNRLIYALAGHSLIARTHTTGGTFSGASEALRRGNGPVSVRDDGSPGAQALIARGAYPVRTLETVEPPLPAQLSLTDCG